MDFTGSFRTGGLTTSALLLAFLLTGDGAQADQVAKSGHRTNDGFRNTNPNFAPPALLDRLAFILRRTWTTTFQHRSIQLPVAENDGRRLRANQLDATVTWIGHSTLLIQLDGVNLLTDPQWSDRASPVGFAGPRRVMPPGLRFEDLPPIHLVLISHDHYDHLDVETVRHLNAVHHPRFVVPLGLKAWFADLGIAEVEELDWWTSVESQGLKLICLPAQHFSGRTLWDGNRRLWSSWAVLGRSKRLFFAGDTGYYDVFQEIGRRLGPFDLAAIPIGAYLPPSIMRMTHVTPEEGLRIFNDVHGRRLVAIHWGTFDMTDEPLDEPPQRLIAEAKRLKLDSDRIWLLPHGETRDW